MSDVLDFIKANATANDKGVHHLAQKSFMEFMSKEGVTKEVYAAVHDAQSKFINGMYEFCSEQMKDSIKEAKKDGRDPKEEKVKLVVNIPDGRISLGAQACRSFKVPGGDPNARVNRTMYMDLDIEQTRTIDKEMVAQTEEDIKKLLGL